ncbi:hypothetical protein CF336_g9304 [Tilletia laevis]|nr:hypothetical protein CF336_g9304 [Tilletia laevis]
MAAALWDHAYMGDLSAFVDNFSARAEVDDYEADPSDILDYNHAWPLDDQDDWTDAISFAYSFGQTVKTKELNFRVVNERSGLSLKDTLLRPLWIVLFLPQGFSKSSKVHLLEVAYAEVLYPVSDAPVIYDQDGMAFELYTWRLDQTNNWEPEEVDKRHMHIFLKPHIPTGTIISSRASSSIPTNSSPSPARFLTISLSIPQKF